MKKRLLMYVLLVVAWLTVPWSVSAAVYVDENFDQCTDGFPTGWENKDAPEGDPYNTNYYNVWNLTSKMEWGTPQKYNETNGAYFNSYGINANLGNTLLSPVFNAPAGGAEISFVYHNMTSKPLKVLVYSADNATILATIADNLQTTYSDGWKKFSAILGDFSAQTGGIRLGFEIVSDYGNDRVYLDNILVEDPPTCAAPTALNFTAITQTSATLNWSHVPAGDPSPDHILRVIDASTGNVVIDNVKINTPTNSYLIEGLSPSSKYDVELTTDCSAAMKGQSKKAAAQVQTLAGPVNLPYTQDFTVTSFEDLLGWGKFAPNEYYVRLENGDGHNANGSIYVQVDKDEVTTLVLPQMNHDFADIQLSMWVKGQKDVQFSLGFMEDPADIATFLPLSTATITENYQWQEMRFNTTIFADYAGITGASFALRLENVQYFTNFQIDDIKIEKAPTCPRIENVEVIATDTAAVDVKFYTYTPNATVKAKVVQGATETVQTLTPTIVAGSNTATAKVTGLEPSTDYTIYLMSSCSATEESELSLPLNVTTPCGTRRDLLFHETFKTQGTLPNCWVQDMSEGVRSAWRMQDIGKDDKYANVNGQRYQDGADSVRLIAQAMLIPEAGKYDLSFRMNRVEAISEWGRSSVDSIEGLQVYISNSTSTIGATKCEFIPLNYEMAPAVRNAGWNEYTFNIDKEGVVYVIFEAIVRQGSVGIDDVKLVEAPACRPTKYITLGAPAATEALLSWRAEGAAEWSVDYTLSSVAGDVKKVETVKTKPEFKFTNLLKGTRYTLKGTITTVCGAGVNSEAVPFEYTFETVCDDVNVLPFTENFDGDMFVPTCWSQYYNYRGYKGSVNMSDSAWARNTDAKFVAKGKGSARMRRVSERASKASLVTPAIVIPQTGNHRLTFYLSRDNRTTYDGLLVIASPSRDIKEGTKDTVLLADFRIGRSFSPVETADGMYKYFVDLPETLRGKYHFIFEAKLDNRDSKDIFVDEVEISEVSPCDYVKGTLSFDSIRHDAVRITVEGDSKTDKYEVEYGPVGFKLGSGTKAVIGAIDAPIYNLSADMTYDVYVRRYCSNSSQSEWGQRPQSFSTLCSPAVISLADGKEFIDGFEDLNIDQEIHPCYIQQYLKDTVAFVGFGADINAKVYPEKGRRFAATLSHSESGKQGVNTYVLRPMSLLKGHLYEVSALVISDTHKSELTNISFVYGQSPMKDQSMVTISTHKVDNKWTLVRGFIHNVPADGTYYVGWNTQQDMLARFAGLDEFRVREVTCVPPYQSAVTNITDASASISWESNASAWDIKVLTENDVNSTTGVVVEKNDLTTKALDLTALTANTKYYYFIRSVCGVGDKSEWTEAGTFSTPCNLVDVPLNEGFEDADLVNFSCWTTFGVTERDLSVANSGVASLRTSKTATIISPKLNVTSLADYRFKANVYSISPNATVTIGVQTDPNDPSTFQAITTLTVTREKRWTELLGYFEELNTPDYVDFKEAKYVVVQFGSDNTYIDDIAIEPADACPQPTAPTINFVGGNSVEIGWSENGSATSWIIEVLQGGVHLFNDTVTTNPATINGLSPLTEYTMNIQAVCNGTPGAKAEVGIVKTTCGALPVPYKAEIRIPSNLERSPLNKALPTCWACVQTSPETQESEDLKEYNAWVGNRAYGYLHYRFSGKTNDNPKGVYGATSTLATSAFDLTNAINPRMEAKLVMHTYDTLYVLISKDGGVSYTPFDTVLKVDNYQDINLSYDLNAHKGANVSFGFKIVVTKAVLDGDGWHGIKFKSFEIKVDETCTRPTELKLTRALDTKAMITIADTCKAHTAWEISYGPVGVNADKGTIAPLSNPDLKAHLLQGLTPSTSYDVYVRAVCDTVTGAYSMWVGPLTFTTNCPATAALPYHETFESYDKIAQSCMAIHNQDAADPTNHYPNAEIVSKFDSRFLGFVNEGNKALYLKSDRWWPLSVILPKFDGAAIDELAVTFDYRNDMSFEGATFQKLELGIAYDDYGSVVFVPYLTLPNTSSFSTVTYRFPYVAPEHANGQIAFRYSNSDGRNFYAAIDNVSVAVDTRCPGASNFAFVSATTDSIKVQHSGKAPKLDIAYGLAGTAPDQCTLVQVTNKADNALDTAAIGGLAPATTYYVFSRGVAADGTTSDWSAPMVVTTDCNVFEVTKEKAYVENFDTYEDMGTPFPPCMTILRDYTDFNTQITYPTLTSEKRVSQPRSLYMYDDNAIALPAMTADLSKTIISFDAQGFGYFRIGVVQDLKSYVFGDTTTIKYLKGGEIKEYLNNVGDIESTEYKGFSASQQVRHYEFDLTADNVNGNYFVFETYYNTQNMSPKIFIDNIKVIMAPTCFEPRKMVQTLLLDTAVAYTWASAPDVTEFEYVLDTFKVEYTAISPTHHVVDTIYGTAQQGKVTPAELTLKNLNANTKYRLSVRGICASCNDTTTWTRIFFSTLRVLGRIPYATGFEEDVENECWYRTGGYEGGGWGFSTFTIDTAKAAVFKGTKGLYVRRFSTAEYGYNEFGRGSSASRPWTNYAYRYFYLEPGNYDVEYDWKQPSTGEDNMARVFVVPASYELTSSNIGHYNQMIPAEAFVLDNGPMQNQPDWKRTKVSFKLDKPGMYKLVVGWTNTHAGKTETTPLPIAIDNITMENHALNAPIALRLDSAKGKEAWLSWTKGVNEKDGFRIVVLDANLDTIASQTLADTLYKVTNLQYATAYKARVRAEVDKYISEWVDLNFTSECMIPTLPYVENFEAVTVPAMPTCWIVNGGWESLFFGGSNVANCSAASAAGVYTITTPAFKVDKAGYHITYRYHNNTSDAVFTIKASVNGKDYTDELIVDGQTASMFEDRWISLDKYAGKEVSFQITAEVKTVANNTRVSFDDFRIACVDKQVVEFNESTCSGSEYVNHGFTITPDQISKEGSYKFERLVKGATADVCDHIERLNLTVGQSYRVELNETICKGKTGYISEAFPVSEVYPNGLMVSGKYQADLKTKTGCDSIIVLNLTVEDNTVVIDTVICEGDVYMFDGKQITESGTYVKEAFDPQGCDLTQTLNITIQPREFVINKYYCEGASYEYKGQTYNTTMRFEEKYTSKHNCDSIIIRNFVVLPTNVTIDTTICQGHSVVFGGVEYKETGTYTKTFQNVAKCDSVVTLNLTVTTPETTTLNDFVCEGRLYSDNGFFDIKATKDTVLTRIESTKAGCDSIIKVNLKFVATIKVDTTVSISEGEVYNFGGNDLTEAGKYTHTFQTAQGCDSIVNLTLVVKTGVDNIAVQSLTIAPNPVRTGVATAVHRDWTADEQDGLRVEILNSVGQIVDAYNPTVYPIVIEPIHVSGVYYIRITTGTGDVYVGKLIVK